MNLSSMTGYERFSSYGRGRIISYEEARDLAIGVAQEKSPGYFDQIGGQYFKSNGDPSCLVGAMLDKLGVTAREMYANYINESGIGRLAMTGVLVPQDERTALFLRSLQSHNDQGMPWETAVRRALSLVGDDPTLVDRKFEEPQQIRIKEIADSWMEIIEPYDAKPVVTVSFKKNVLHTEVEPEHVLAA